MIDLLVVGGGPAGLATALRGARAGLDVTVIERRGGVIDKACGEGLMPHTLSHLQRLGIDPAGMPIRGISYLDGVHRVSASFTRGAGRGVRRTVLHSALRDAAVNAGVVMCREELSGFTQDAVSVRIGRFRARYLAAADGLHSPIRRSLGLERRSAGRRRWGIRRHVQITPWTEHVEVHWAPDAEAYVTPVGVDEVGIAILTSQQGGFDRHLAQFPTLCERTLGLAHGRDRAAGPLRQRVSGRNTGRVLLVGDAAGYLDALTGEGLGLAFGGAEALVDCVLADRPEAYDRRWRAQTRRYRLMTAALLAASSRPAVRSRIVPAAVAMPAVFGAAVNSMAF